MSDAPTCFVMMPFDLKKDPISGRVIDFNAVYDDALHPAIVAAGLLPLRGDLDAQGGIIHKSFFEKLILCDFAVADLTTHNPNVFYEYGARHALRPRTTIAVTAHPEALPFDVTPLRAVTYKLDSSNKLAGNALEEFKASLTLALEAARERVLQAEGDPLRDADSPVFQLIQGLAPPDLSHLRADRFPERVRSEQQLSNEIKDVRLHVEHGNDESLAAAREKLAEIAQRVDANPDSPANLRIEVMLAHRALDDWDQMVATYEAFPPEVQRQRIPREQYAMALNRLSDRDSKYSRMALDELRKVEKDFGTSAETSGLIGRVYKDRWLKAFRAGESGARSLLKDATAAYRRGFNADLRDFYPGINYATLLFAAGEQRRAELEEVLPVVRYAVSQRLTQEPENYWVHATLCELSVLTQDEDAAVDHLDDAISRIEEAFQPKTTAKNLSIIKETAPDQSDVGFIEQLREELLKKASKLGT